jgi:hypothetical protein
MHVGALRRLQPSKQEKDTFPTRYRMNTRRALERLFARPRFELYAYTQDPEPYLYAGSSTVITGIVRLLQRLPGPLKSTWLIYVRKAADPASGDGTAG